jgi:hypothetical protein
MPAKIRRRRKSALRRDTRDRLISWRDAWDELEFLEAAQHSIFDQHSGFFFGTRYGTKAELEAAILQRGHSSLERWRTLYGNNN